MAYKSRQTNRVVYGKTQEKYNQDYNQNYYSQYSQGNLAYELNNIPTYEDVQNEDIVPVERTEIKKKNKPKVKKVQPMSPYYIKVVSIAIFVFLGSVAFVASQVRVDKMSVNIRYAKAELKSIREQNAILNAERMEEIDLEYIKREATERLNMSEPQPHQIVYIDVPKQSYTIQHNSGS